MKNEGVMVKILFQWGMGGINRVKKVFYDKRHSWLIICQHEIYLLEKYVHSRMKNEKVMAKILFECGGGANRVNEGFYHRKHLGLII